MTAAARRQSVEPADSPVNAMLDLAESAIRTCCDHGGEAALRTRLARLLPPPLPPPVGLPGPSAWEWAQIVAALRASRAPAAQTEAARQVASSHLAAALAADIALTASRPSDPISPGASR